MKKIIAVIGAAAPSKEQYEMAEKVGRLIAGRGWTLINGGLTGVMEASAKGASLEGGEVIGILPTPSRNDANRFVTTAIATGMGHARNVIIVQSADACIAIGKGKGTLSEIAIALKIGRKVVALDSWEIPGVVCVPSPEKAVEELA